jgi:hypothetical protein
MSARERALGCCAAWRMETLRGATRARWEQTRLDYDLVGACGRHSLVPVVRQVGLVIIPRATCSPTPGRGHMLLLRAHAKQAAHLRAAACLSARKARRESSAVASRAQLARLARAPGTAPQRCAEQSPLGESAQQSGVAYRLQEVHPQGER